MSWVLSLNLTPVQFMILSQAIIFILGWPLEWTEIIVIFVPIFLPMLKHFGIDPILRGRRHHIVPEYRMTAPLFAVLFI